jgi:hypothetical protein
VERDSDQKDMTAGGSCDDFQNSCEAETTLVQERTSVILTDSDKTKNNLLKILNEQLRVAPKLR